jgi:hypothetical protein
MQVILLAMTRLLIRQVAEKKATLNWSYDTNCFSISADNSWIGRLTLLLDNCTTSSSFVDCSSSTQVASSKAHGLIRISENVWASPANAKRQLSPQEASGLFVISSGTFHRKVLSVCSCLKLTILKTNIFVPICMVTSITISTKFG